MMASYNFQVSITFNSHFGQWKNGAPDGKGKLLLEAGISYEGGVVCGALSGRGVLSVNGNHYVGEFQDGKVIGNGRAEWCFDQTDGEMTTVAFERSWDNGAASAGLVNCSSVTALSYTVALARQGCLAPARGSWGAAAIGMAWWIT